MFDIFNLTASDQLILHKNVVNSLELIFELSPRKAIYSKWCLQCLVKVSTTLEPLPDFFTFKPQFMSLGFYVLDQHK